MRIDGRISAETNGLTDAYGLGNPAKAAKAAAQESQPEAEMTLSPANASYLAQAQNAPEVDTAAVARVRAMLDNGELDSAAAIRDTAKAMLSRGL